MYGDSSSPLLAAVLMDSLVKLNKGLPLDAITEAVAKLRTFDTGSLVQKNMTFMDYLQNGMDVSYTENGEEKATRVQLIDYENVSRNSFIFANQWTFVEKSEKRPDGIIFVNGLPLVIVELKSPSREETDASEAYRQFRNYMQEIPSLFVYNAILVMSDMAETKDRRGP